MEKVKCPHCNKEFPLEEGFQAHLKALEKQSREKVEKSFKEKNKQNEIKFKKLEEQNKIKDKEIKNAKTLQESAIKKARADEKVKVQQELKAELKEKDQEIKNAKTLQESAIKKARADEKVKAQQELKAELKEKDQEIKNAKTLQASAIKNARADEKLKGETERQKEKLKNQRLEKDLEKMRRKFEQGGSADEGSKQEHVLIDYLKNTVFKNNREDTFYAYAKGEKGGDVLQEVVEKGKLIGKILYESKNTDSFPSSNAWITKLHQDMSAAKADIGIFFTRALPKYFNKDEDYYKDNNIFICKYDWMALRLLASINRILLIKAKKAGGDGKGNQIGIIDFFNNTKIKNLIPVMMKSHKAVRPNLVKIQNTAQKALEDHDDSYKKLLDLFDQLAEVGVDFDFEK